jgi:hypothetical protein
MRDTVFGQQAAALAKLAAAYLLHASCGNSRCLHSFSFLNRIARHERSKPTLSDYRLSTERSNADSLDDELWCKNLVDWVSESVTSYSVIFFMFFRSAFVSICYVYRPNC